MEKKTRIGVIGVGYLGRYHAEKYKAMPEVDLVGVADSNAHRARDIANALGTRAFSDYRDLVGAVDAVSVVVPTKAHHQVTLHCLEQGVDVLIEKPMTTTLAEADEIIAMADNCQRIVQVGHIERFNPAVLAMEQYITTPVFIESHRIAPYTARGADVDVVLDLMIHDLDLILAMVDSSVATMHAVGVPVVTETSDIANVRLIFENGCTANITVSRISKVMVRKMRVFQPKSYLSVNFADKEIAVIEHLDERGRDGLPRERVHHHRFQDKDALETELRAFVLNVRQRTRPKVDAHAGRRALKVALQVIEHMRAYVADHRELLDLP